MSTYRITEKMTTYAVVDVEADSPEEALRIAEDGTVDLIWDYDTDFDSSTLEDISEIA